jgi:hypothetical protein
MVFLACQHVDKGRGGDGLGEPHGQTVTQDEKGRDV